MKNKCDIVQDLLPLYVDGCCTQSSRELVEEHLQECAACKQVFGEMTGDIPTPEEPQPEAEPVPAEPVPEEPETAAMAQTDESGEETEEARASPP